MKRLGICIATLGLLYSVGVAGCRSGKNAPDKPKPLDSLLVPLHHQLVNTIYDTMDYPREHAVSDQLFVEIEHREGDVLMCFRDGAYIDVEKCLPGMRRGMNHSALIKKTRLDTITVVSLTRASYTRFVADTGFNNVLIDWDQQHCILRYKDPYYRECAIPEL
jgi:hypothetical protein